MIQIILGSKSDMPITQDGIEILKEFEVNFSLQIASAHRSPELLDQIIGKFEKDKGKIYICVAGMSAHLGGVVAAKTIKPVIAVPISRQATAGLDSLLSISQMPKGIPVAAMGFDVAGFTNGVLIALSILALHDSVLREKLIEYRRKMVADVIIANKENQIIWRKR